jgi:hypothetical protein
MLTGLWPSPSGCEEFVLSFDQARARRLLVIPALFDEGNKLRHFTVELMRRLDEGGVDCFLPDLPGTNESPAPLAEQTLSLWRDHVAAAARHFRTTHLLAIRGGAVLDPRILPSMHYASARPASQLLTLARAQALAAREAGNPVTREDLLAEGQAKGVALAGHAMGAQMVRELLAAQAPTAAARVAQGELGGGGLWLRAEPAHDPQQADRLAELVLERLA